MLGGGIADAQLELAARDGRAWRGAIDAELSELLPSTPRTARELDAILSISRAMMTGLLIHDQLLKDEAHIDFVINQWIALARR